MNSPHDEKKRQTQASKLGQRIRAAGSVGSLTIPLQTSERIIARVTDGIYREPWAAFRELCANSYDADAKRVVIETGAPEFDQVTVRDDGIGMSPETLAYVVQNIGGSSKRTSIGAALHTASVKDSERSPGGRPLIGKIGIGLFAVAQLTQHFQIITKAKGERFRTWATVVLRTHNESHLKGRNPEVDFDAGDVTISSEEVPTQEVDTHGTTIVLHQMRPEIRRVLQSLDIWLAQFESTQLGESDQPTPTYYVGHPSQTRRKLAHRKPKLPWESKQSSLEKFRALVMAAGETEKGSKSGPTLEQFDEYLRSIWKLSLSLPLKYMNGHPFDLTGDTGLLFLDVPKGSKRTEPIKMRAGESVRTKLKLIAGTEGMSDFDVLFDGVLLRRPIQLATKLASPSRIGSPVMMIGNEEAPFKNSELDRAGGPLRFEAYLYWNSKITPKDAQGALIRVHEASGTLFDQRFLDYQVSEQNRLRQITAEIFVLEGLDGAINIDRESYNFSHPHYIYIQKWIHRALRLLVNRLKSIAKEDLELDRAQMKARTQQQTLSSALTIWSHHRQEDEPTITKEPLSELPAAIADATIKWVRRPLDQDVSLATALSVVLEAYGVLSELRQDERSNLINDLIQVMRVHVAK